MHVRMYRHTYTQMYVQCTGYVQYVQMYCTHMSEICKSGRIVVDIDTIVIVFMKARSVLTIEMKCLLLCGMFTLEIIQFCKSTTHTVVLLWLVQ